ncbi:MAG: hypothetical protein A2X86_10340 [Bdellovibrionales bacterium GWA2_49_15]|nr:MAG: hypothetical protein A2X86_10340 [Bdellovibrionales bacterium GWA2_49_15]
MKWAILGVLGFIVMALTTKAKASDTGVKSTANKWSRFDSLFKKYASINNLDWRWLKTFCMKETSLGYHPKVARGLAFPNDVDGSTSEDKKSWGLMQLILPTASSLAGRNITPIDLNNPEISIQLSAKYIGVLNKRYKGNIRDIAMAYNQGEPNQDRFLELERLGRLSPKNYPAAREYFDKWKEWWEYLANLGEFK